MDPTLTSAPILRQIPNGSLSSEERAMLDPQTVDQTPEATTNGSPSRLRWLKMATSDTDRSGDVIVIRGMDSTDFLRNPQFLWQHGKTGALVNTIGTIRQVVATDTALYALAEYATEEISPLAEQVFRMDTAGYLPANSIGFRPIEWEENSNGGYTFTKWELIECSKVELPMNPNAIDDGMPKSLDNDSGTYRQTSIEHADSWLAYEPSFLP